MRKSLTGVLTVLSMLILTVAFSAQGSAQETKMQGTGVRGTEDAEVTEMLQQMTIQERWHSSFL